MQKMSADKFYLKPRGFTGLFLNFFVYRASRLL
jgi:hypothetical protein